MRQQHPFRIFTTQRKMGKVKQKSANLMSVGELGKTATTAVAVTPNLDGNSKHHCQENGNEI